MKRNLMLLIILTLISFTTRAQSKNQVSLYGNYVLVPHNYLQGAGYSVGYNHRFTKLFWIDSEFSYGQALRVKDQNNQIGNYKNMPLTYIFSGYYLDIAPTLRFKFLKRISVSAGFGLALSYGSMLNNNYHYTIPDGMFGEEEITGVKFIERYSIGNNYHCQIGYDIDSHLSINIKGSYSFVGVESILQTGIGLSYSF